MIPEFLHTFVLHMNVIVRRVASNNDLSLSQYFALANISISGISMTDLSTMVGVDNSTLTRNINILIKRELVIKEKSIKDKRGFIITLSPSGDMLMNNLENQIEAILETFIDSVDSGTRQNLIDILETVNWKANCFINDL
jgi:DNA-binding MarR family transcriptional regulator